MNAATRADLRRPDGTPVRALVVDDEPTLAELLSMALRYEGWDVRSAGDGLGAVRQGREFRPDVVVLDVMLPDIDGFEVLRRLRADSPDVPVLFLTARDAVEDRVAGITAGGDDYVTKPFSLEEVVARLRGLLRRAAVATARPRRRGAGRRRPDPRRGQPRGHPRRRAGRAHRHRVRAPALPDAQPAPGAVEGPDPRPRAGTTTSAGSRTSSSSTSPTCARRSTPAARR